MGYDTYRNGEIEFSDEISLENAKKAIEYYVTPETEVNGLTLKFFGDTRGEELEWLIVRMSGIISGKVECQGENPEDAYDYTFKKGKWYWQKYIMKKDGPPKRLDKFESDNPWDEIKRMERNGNPSNLEQAQIEEQKRILEPFTEIDKVT